MSKQRALATAIVCVLGLSLLASLFGAFSYAVQLQVLNLNRISHDTTRVFHLVLVLVLVLISSIIGWKLSGFKHKDSPTDNYIVLKKIPPRTWLIVFVSLAFLISTYFHASITFRLSSELQNALWQIFSNYDVLAPNQIENVGVVFNFPAVFFINLLFHPVTYVLWLTFYISYTLNKTRVLK